MEKWSDGQGVELYRHSLMTRRDLSEGTQWENLNEDGATDHSKAEKVLRDSIAGFDATAEAFLEAGRKSGNPHATATGIALTYSRDPQAALSNPDFNREALSLLTLEAEDRWHGQNPIYDPLRTFVRDNAETYPTHAMLLEDSASPKTLTPAVRADVSNLDPQLFNRVVYTSHNWGGSADERYSYAEALHQQYDNLLKQGTDNDSIWRSYNEISLVKGKLKQEAELFSATVKPASQTSGPEGTVTPRSRKRWWRMGA